MSVLLKSLRGLLAYTIWADRQILEAMAALPVEELRRENGSSFGCLLYTMAHLLAGEQIWLSRFLGSPPASLPAAGDYAELPSLAAGFTDLWPQLEFFLASLSSSQIEADLFWTNSAGESHTAPFHRALLHFVNHATYHRGQVVVQLRQAGVAPPPTDLIYWRGEL